jgi:hypothetical protein
MRRVCLWTVASGQTEQKDDYVHVRAARARAADRELFRRVSVGVFVYRDYIMRSRPSAARGSVQHESGTRCSSPTCHT